MSDNQQNVLCFGGFFDGHCCHPHEDPPLGYQEKYCIVDGKPRKFFLYNRIKRVDIYEEVLQASISNMDKDCHV